MPGDTFRNIGRQSQVRHLLLTKTDIVVHLGQDHRADDPGQPHRDLEQHQDEDVGSLSVVILDVFGLDGKGGDEEDEEDDVEEREDVVDSAEAAVFLNITVERQAGWAHSDGDLVITRAQFWHDWQHQPIITSSVSRLQTQSNKHGLMTDRGLAPACLSSFLEDVPLDEDNGLHQDAEEEEERLVHGREVDPGVEGDEEDQLDQERGVDEDV